MRFVGLVLVLLGVAVSFFLGYRGMTVDEARARLARLLNLPGLAPSTSSSSNGYATAESLNQLNLGVLDPRAILERTPGAASKAAGQA